MGTTAALCKQRIELIAGPLECSNPGTSAFPQPILLFYDTLAREPNSKKCTGSSRFPENAPFRIKLIASSTKTGLSSIYSREDKLFYLAPSSASAFTPTFVGVSIILRVGFLLAYIVALVAPLSQIDVHRTLLLRGGRGGINRRWKKVQARAEHEENFKHRLRKKLKSMSIPVPDSIAPKQIDRNGLYHYTKRWSERKARHEDSTSASKNRREAKDILGKEKRHQKMFSTLIKRRVFHFRLANISVRSDTPLDDCVPQRQAKLEKKTRRSIKLKKRVKGKIGALLRRGMDPKEYKSRRARKLKGRRKAYSRVIL
eukprot:jgi/Bigna1/147363/aug1.143_g22071